MRGLVILLFAVLFALPGVARAQGFGSFVSPGPLTSDHADIDTVTGCPNCHAPGRGPTPDRCFDCHESVEKQVTTKTGFHKTRGAECESCHAEHRGRDHKLIPDLSLDRTFDHYKDTGWPLEGDHGRIRCIACHTTPRVYVGLDQECASCHDDPHGADQSTRTILQDCDNCHTAEDWKALPIPLDLFDHDAPADADYPLEGEHSDVACEECHVDLVFVPVDFELCTSCHVNPHRAPFKARDCESCHPDPSTWEVPRFDHDLTRYALEGEHVPVACEECHPGDKTAPIAFQRCETCHDDLHHGQFEPRPCDECHTVQVAAFALRDYDHDQTEFPLVGKHAEQECEECHGDGEEGEYAELAHADCDDCHDDAHEGRFQPTDCQLCHTPEGFEVAVFDHSQTTFPHTGRHVGLDCNQCHRDFQWNDIPHASCNDCHYVKNPHSDAITPDRCEECHVTEGFDVIRFDHVTETGFDLAPAHDTLACASCHEQVQDFVELDPACEACHEEEKPANHYEGECVGCHDSAHWQPAGLGDNDHAITGFLLAGAHSLEPCESCHAPNEARGLARPECVACHDHDDPHQHLLGTQCADCHGEVTWLRTAWRHTTTGWPLRGSHRLAACVDCHAGGYIGTPTECARCHAAEAVCASPRCINAHGSPEFPNCDSCHVVWSWTVGTERFPH